MCRCEGGGVGGVGESAAGSVTILLLLRCCWSCSYVFCVVSFLSLATAFHPHACLLNSFVCVLCFVFCVCVRVCSNDEGVQDCCSRVWWRRQVCAGEIKETQRETYTEQGCTPVCDESSLFFFFFQTLILPPSSSCSSCSSCSLLPPPLHPPLQ